MAWTRDVSFNQSYENVLMRLYAEDPMAVRGAVRSKTGIVGKVHHFDRLGGVAMVPVTSRHQDTPLTPLTHTRRRVSLTDYALSELIDPLDNPKAIINPQNDYTQRFIESYHRRVALTVMTAMDANATAVGADDTTSNVALPTGQVIANSSTGMTVDKVRRTARILDVAGVPRSERYAAVSPFAIEDLMADLQVTSSDFTTLKALMGGSIQGETWYGFKWLVISDADPDDGSSASPTTASILPKSGNIRTCFFWHKQAIGLAIGKDLSVEVDARADKMNSTQVLVQVSIGATRIFDRGVVTVDIDESV